MTPDTKSLKISTKFDIDYLGCPEYYFLIVFREHCEDSIKRLSFWRVALFKKKGRERALDKLFFFDDGKGRGKPNRVFTVRF